MNWAQLHEYRRSLPDGWRLPEPQDFKTAKDLGIMGFVPDTQYWASGGSVRPGDALSVLPEFPENYTICNSYDVCNCVRLVKSEVVGVRQSETPLSL